MAASPFLVFRRELRGTFLSPIAYIVIAVFLAVTGWLFFSPFFLNDRADLREFFSLLPLILSFVIPAITMRIFAEEYRGGTFEITRTLPVPVASIIAGKFLASLTLVAVMLLPTVSYAVSVSALGELDWGPVVGGYLGALLLGAAYTAIGLFASSLTKNQIVAYITGIALVLFFTIVDRMLLFLPPNLAGLFQYLAADFHFQNVARGVFDTRDLVYFLTLPALALYATLLVLAPPTIRNRERLTVGLQFGAHASFLLFIAVVQLASGSLFARVDLTQDRIHSLSPISRDAVASLREPVTVRAFFSRNLPAPFNNVERSLRDLLGSYALQNPEQFNFAFYSMTKPEESLNLSDEDLTENERLARQYGVFPIQIQQVEADEIKLINAYMGVTVIHGDTARTLPAITSTEQLEFELTTAIQALTGRTSALLSRSEPIRIDLYLSSSLVQISPDFEQLPEQVRQIVRDLNPEYFGRLAHALHDPSFDAEVRRIARELQLPALSFGRQDGGAADEEAYATIVIDSGERLAQINLIRTGPLGYGLVDAETLSQEIRANLDTQLSPQLTFGYLVGNDTPPYRGFGTPRETPIVVPDLANFYQLVTQEYEVDGFFAENGLPDGLRTALVVGPRGEFSDFELFQLDQFLMRGGSLALFLDAFDIAIEGNRSTYFERQTGIEKLIEHYGVRLMPGLLLDQRSYIVNEIDPSGVAVQSPVYSAPEISREQLNADFPFLRNIENMILLNVTPVELAEELPEGVTAHPMIRSSEEGWVITEPNFNSPVTAQPPPDSEQSQFTIAYLLEGAFDSYFADKPLPTPPAGDEAGPAPIDDERISIYREFLPRSTGGKLLVMGTSMTFHNSLIDAEGRLPVALFVQNTIDFMNGREGVAEMRAKGARFRPLDETTPFVRALTKYLNIAGLPMLVILAGLVVWLLHRARRRQIQRMFAEGDRA
jgi:ABC-type uncharacterized transport system involved in gliding motility auxiliary subunit